MRRLFKLNARGFTLIEAFISLARLSIVIGSFIMMQSRFTMQTADRTLMNALRDAASSAPTYNHENNISVTVALSGLCSPAANQ